MAPPGVALVVLGVFTAAYAAVRFRRGLASLARGESPGARSAVAHVTVVVARCLLGAAAVWYFLAVS